MSSEAALRALFRDKLRPYGRIVRIESATEAGIPDCYCLLLRVPCWVELKCVPERPRRDATPLRVYSLTDEQVNWLEEEERCGGRAFLLVQVGREWLLFPGRAARVVKLGAAMPALRALALVVGEWEFPTQEVLRWMTGKERRGASGASAS